MSRPKSQKHTNSAAAQERRRATGSYQAKIDKEKSDEAQIKKWEYRRLEIEKIRDQLTAEEFARWVDIFDAEHRKLEKEKEYIRTGWTGSGSLPKELGMNMGTFLYLVAKVFEIAQAAGIIENIAISQKAFDAMRDERTAEEVAERAKEATDRDLVMPTRPPTSSTMTTDPYYFRLVDPAFTAKPRLRGSVRKEAAGDSAPKDTPKDKPQSAKSTPKKATDVALRPQAVKPAAETFGTKDDVATIEFTDQQVRVSPRKEEETDAAVVNIRDGVPVEARSLTAASDLYTIDTNPASGNFTTINIDGNAATGLIAFKTVDDAIDYLQGGAQPLTDSLGNPILDTSGNIAQWSLEGKYHFIKDNNILRIRSFGDEAAGDLVTISNFNFGDSVAKFGFSLAKSLPASPTYATAQSVSLSGQNIASASGAIVSNDQAGRFSIVTTDASNNVYLTEVSGNNVLIGKTQIANLVINRGVRIYKKPDNGGSLVFFEERNPTTRLTKCYVAVVDSYGKTSATNLVGSYTGNSLNSASKLYFDAGSDKLYIVATSGGNKNLEIAPDGTAVGSFASGLPTGNEITFTNPATVILPTGEKVVTDSVLSSAAISQPNLVAQTATYPDFIVTADSAIGTTAYSSAVFQSVSDAQLTVANNPSATVVISGPINDGSVLLHDVVNDISQVTFAEFSERDFPPADPSISSATLIAAKDNIIAADSGPKYAAAIFPNGQILVFPGVASKEALQTLALDAFSFAAPTVSSSVTPSETTTVTTTQTATLTITRTVTTSVSPSTTDSVSISATGSISDSNSASGTVSTTKSVTETRSRSTSPTSTPTKTVSITSSKTRSATGSLTQSQTDSVTSTASRTVTQSRTVTPTYSATGSETGSVTNTESATTTPSASGTGTDTATRSSSVTTSASGSISRTSSATYSSSMSMSQSASMSASATVSALASASSTQTPSVTGTASESGSVTPSITASLTSSSSRTVTRTRSRTVTESNSLSVTPTDTGSVTNSASSTVTKTKSRTKSETSSESKSISGSVTTSVSKSQTRTRTKSATVTNSETKTTTQTGTNTPTVTSSATSKESVSRTTTTTRSGTPSVTSSASITLSPSVTGSATLTPSTTISITATKTPTPTGSVSETIYEIVTSTSSITVTKTSTTTPSGTKTTTRTTPEVAGGVTFDVPTIVGSSIGGVAGLAIIVAAVILAVRKYNKTQLKPDDTLGQRVADQQHAVEMTPQQAPPPQPNPPVANAADDIDDDANLEDGKAADSDDEAAARGTTSGTTGLGINPTTIIANARVVREKAKNLQQLWEELNLGSRGVPERAIENLARLLAEPSTDYTHRFQVQEFKASLFPGMTLTEQRDGSFFAIPDSRARLAVSASPPRQRPHTLAPLAGTPQRHDDDAHQRELDFARALRIPTTAAIDAPFTPDQPVGGRGLVGVGDMPSDKSSSDRSSELTSGSRSGGSSDNSTSRPSHGLASLGLTHLGTQTGLVTESHMAPRRLNSQFVSVAPTHHEIPDEDSDAEEASQPPRRSVRQATVGDGPVVAPTQTQQGGGSVK